MARKRTRSTSVFSEAASTANAIHSKDLVAEERAERDRAQRSSMLLAKIQPREIDTRPLKDRHVEELVESIAALGLIEPLVVDSNGILLAGGHRLAALSLLRNANAEAYFKHFPEDFIPVRIMPFDSTEEPELALQVELAENEKRVNYSKDQIERLASRLKELNYRQIRGRPKKGEKALGPALAVAIGVSTRYVRKVLNENKDAKNKNRNSVPISENIRLLTKAERDIEALVSLADMESDKQEYAILAKAIPGFIKKLRKCIKAEIAPPRHSEE